jgi:hypothetical protein
MLFRDVSITYRGHDYTVTPSIRLLRMIEGRGKRDDPTFNLAMSVFRMVRGDVSHGDIAFLVAELVNSAGAKTTADAAWAWLQELPPDEITATIAVLAECFLSPETKGKKPEAPAT